jgi:hemoglobin/transferrin/lactoferrin receptor protein
MGLGYQAESGRWGSELTSTISAARDENDVDRTEIDQFATPSYVVVDWTAFVELPGGFRLQAALYNLSDETYWTWSDAAGLALGSPVLDRYTSPGRSAAVALRYGR